MGSATVTHIRLWIALPAIIIVHFLFTGSLVPRDLGSIPFLYIAVSGFVGFCLADLFIFRAFVEIGARETLVILTLSPIFSAVISFIFLNERLLIVQALGIIGTIAGVMWVVFEKGSPQEKKKGLLNLGVLYAFFGAFAQAVAMVLSKFGLQEGMHPVSANLIRIIFGLIGLIIFALLRGQFVNDFRKMKDRKALTFVTAGALVGPVLGIILTLYALTMAPVGIVTALMQISPVMLLPIDRFLFKKTISLGAVGGTFLAIAGAMVLILF